MNLKKDIDIKIKNIINKKQDEEQFLKKLSLEIKNIIFISKKSGISLRYTVYCILEAIENKLSDTKLFSKIINEIITVLQNIIKEDFKKKDKETKIIHEDIEEISDGIKEYILDNGFVLFFHKKKIKSL